MKSKRFLWMIVLFFCVFFQTSNASTEKLVESLQVLKVRLTELADCLKKLSKTSGDGKGPESPGAGVLDGKDLEVLRKEIEKNKETDFEEKSYISFNTYTL